MFRSKETKDQWEFKILYDFVFQGKTLTTIALILTNFHKGKPLPVEKCVSVFLLDSNVLFNLVTLFQFLLCVYRKNSPHLSRLKPNHQKVIVLLFIYSVKP